MANPALPASLSLVKTAQGNQLHCRGAWTLTAINKKALEFTLQKIKQQNLTALILDASAITNMDSSGAWQLYQWLQQLSEQGIKVSLVGLQDAHNTLFNGIKETAKYYTKLPTLKEYKGITLLGKKIIDQLLEAQAFLYFIGKIFIEGVHTWRNPSLLRVNATMSIIENTGLLALGIIALLSFMIGIVLTYQMSVQLKNYGATLFIVDLLGLAILREFAPLLTAIMVAGRSGSSFTAQLGMMKIKEEIDALKTMGVLPSQLLILPRILGLTLALPLLTVWADIFGLLGGMMAMTHSIIHLGYGDFLRRFPHVVQLSSLIIGVAKAPVFALIISSIACFQGLRVQGSADSVGKQTTRSVVQAIFFIIVADALFSILLSTLNI
jgi:phospholipid/cholesterol/gamma-HCH transport system permease protein